MTQDDAHYWDAIAADWQQGRSQALWRRHSDAVNACLLSRWLPPGRVRRVLKTDLFDEAFGDGLYLPLAGRAEQVVGIDISTRIAEAAEHRHPGLQAVTADVRRLPFEDGWFDVVFSNSTLDHFASRDDIQVSLRELARVLRVGGQLLLTLDNPANPVVWLRNVLPQNWLHRLGVVPYHVGATCGPARLKQYLTHAGMEMHEITAILHCPRAIAVFLANRLARRGSAERQERFLRTLLAFERLQRWPTRFWTGYFVAARATKRGI